MSLPTLSPRIILGHRFDVKKNVHYITDTDILYPCGVALVIQNFTKKTQKNLPLPEKTINVRLLLLSPKRWVQPLGWHFHCLRFTLPLQFFGSLHSRLFFQECHSRFGSDTWEGCHPHIRCENTEKSENIIYTTWSSCKKIWICLFLTRREVRHDDHRRPWLDGTRLQLGKRKNRDNNKGELFNESYGPGSRGKQVRGYPREL